MISKDGAIKMLIDSLKFIYNEVIYADFDEFHRKDLRLHIMETIKATADIQDDHTEDVLDMVKQAPVAWGIPNTRPTERSPLMQVLLDKSGCQYPELLVPLYAAPQVKQEPVIPKGWKLVPVEPAEEILTRMHNANDSWFAHNGDRMKFIYKASLSAAPSYKQREANNPWANVPDATALVDDLRGNDAEGDKP